MSTKITVKGQVTLPKSARDAVNLKPGDEVEVRPTASGTLIIEKAGRVDDYRARVLAVAKRRVIRGTTEEIMEMTRGPLSERART